MEEKDLEIRKRKNDSGLVTVETALFLVIFMAFYLTILWFGRLAYAEIVMQQALDATAMQISQYGYVLTKTGVVSAINKTAKEAEETKKNIETVKTGIQDFTSALDGVSDYDISDSDIEKIKTAYGSGKEAYTVASGYFKDPKGLLTGLLAIGQAKAENQVLTYLVGAIASGQIEGYLESICEDPDAYLKRLGIVDGLAGLDFSQSSLIADQTQDVYVTVEFRVKSPISMFNIGERTVRLSASTRIW